MDGQYIDIINIIVALVSCLTGVFITVVIAILTWRHEHRIAEKSGAFAKPRIKLGIFNHFIDDKGMLPSLWILRVPGNQGDYAVFPINFILYNDGDASCEDAVLIIHLPTYCYPHFIQESAKLEINPGVFEGDFSRHVRDLGNFSEYSYKIPRISPKSGAQIIDYILIEPIAFLPVDFDVVFKNEIPARLRLSLHTNYQIALTILLKDSPPVRVNFGITGISVGSLDDAVQRYLDFATIDREREIASYPSYIHYQFKRLFRKKVERTVHFVEYTATNDVMELNNKRIFIMGLDTDLNYTSIQEFHYI